MSISAGSNDNGMYLFDIPSKFVTNNNNNRISRQTTPMKNIENRINSQSSPKCAEISDRDTSRSPCVSKKPSQAKRTQSQDEITQSQDENGSLSCNLPKILNLNTEFVSKSFFEVSFLIIYYH